MPDTSPGITGSVVDSRDQLVFVGQDMFIRGFNPDVDQATTPEDIWTEGGLIPFPAVAGPITFVSTSPNDTFGGSGAQVLVFLGIDEEFNETTETVIMLGQTPVITPNDFLYMNQIIVVSAGASEVNEGLITASIDGQVVNTISIGASITRSCAAIMPQPIIPDTFPHLVRMFASVGKQPNALVTFSLHIRQVSTGVIVQALDIPVGSDAAPFSLDLVIASNLAAGDRISVQVSESSANNVLVSAILQVAWVRHSG